MSELIGAFSVTDETLQIIEAHKKRLGVTSNSDVLRALLRESREPIQHLETCANADGCATHIETLSQVIADIATELGCAPDNEEILQRIAAVRKREAAFTAFLLRCSAENPASIGNTVSKAVELLERFGIEPRAPGLFFRTIEADENDARAAIFNAEVKPSD